MERVTEQEQTTEVFENDIQLYLSMFCERDGIEDMTEQPQSVWNAALRYIYHHVFKGGVLKQHKCIDNPNSTIQSTYNSYNYDMVLDVLDIYIYDMCMRYNKEVSIIGFSTLTGINESVIYDWGNESTKLSTVSLEIYKKLNRYREESLSNKLATGKQNPVGVIAILNRQFGWASPYTSDARKQQSKLSSEEIRALLSTRNGQNEPKQIETQDIVVND